MGTPEFAVPGLRELIRHHEVVAVCTQPDRPAGRGHKLTPSPVKVVAEEHGIDVLQPVSLRIRKGESNDEVKKYRARLKDYGADIFVVAAYGLILPKAVLEIAPLGSVNIHASLLPKYRGASPIHVALLNGDAETGVTIMHMDVGIDTGDMILKKTLEIFPDERFLSLHDRVAALGGECIVEALALLENGTADRVAQDDGASCYAPMIKKSDGHIDWSMYTAQIINRLRAFDSWPGVFFVYKGAVMKVWGIDAAEGVAGALPGTILSADAVGGLVIATGDGAARITEIQPSGKKRMLTRDYLRGARMEVGVRVEYMTT